MPYTNNAKNLMLDALRAAITQVSLHTADPGTTGASEVSGGSPAYARKAIAFNAASGGSIDDSTNGIDFDVPAGTTVTHVGYWAGSTFMGSSSQTPETFGSQGIYRLTDADLDLNAV